MRYPAKSDHVYRVLRDDIVMRRLPPERQLPHETELAVSYRVSRSTLRVALARLEEESLIYRVRGKGTYTSARKDRPTITFLLPCTEHLDRRSGSSLEILQGALDLAPSLFPAWVHQDSVCRPHVP